jgi:hypothetical protein
VGRLFRGAWIVSCYGDVPGSKKEYSEMEPRKEVIYMRTPEQTIREFREIERQRRELVGKLYEMIEVLDSRPARRRLSPFPFGLAENAIHKALDLLAKQIGRFVDKCAEWIRKQFSKLRKLFVKLRSAN